MNETPPYRRRVTFMSKTLKSRATYTPEMLSFIQNGSTSSFRCISLKVKPLFLSFFSRKMARSFPGLPPDQRSHRHLASGRAVDERRPREAPPRLRRDRAPHAARRFSAIHVGSLRGRGRKMGKVVLGGGLFGVMQSKGKASWQERERGRHVCLCVLFCWECDTEIGKFDLETWAHKRESKTTASFLLFSCK